MNRDHVLAELPPSVATWLDAHAPEAWEKIAWAVAVALGRRLLARDGEGGYVAAGQLRASIRDGRLLRSDAPSPGVAALLADLPRGRRWSAQFVARAVCVYLDLPNAGALQRVIKAPDAQQQDAPTPVSTP